MPVHRCFYCGAMSNFSSGPVSSGGKLAGVICVDKCQNCNTPTVFIATDDSRTKILDRYPKLETEPDEELPAEVKVAFREAMKALNEGIWNGCVIMCRRALEEAMNDLGAEGADLFKKIDYLENERKITPELREWAHEGRLGGKLGAHGTKLKKWADKDDAEEIMEFSRWFFRYVYVLPAQLAERKAKVTPSGDEPASQETA